MSNDSHDELSKYDYFKNKLADKTYMSKSFREFEFPDVPRMRIMSKVFDSSENHEFIDIQGEVVLRVTSGERQEIKATFYEDNRNIKTLTFQRYRKKDGKPQSLSFNFQNEEIEKIIAFLFWIKTVQLDNEEKEKFDDDVLLGLFDQINYNDKKRFLLENLDLVAEVAKHNVTASDITALGYRKKQLQIFGSLLYDPTFFEVRKQEKNLRGPEAVWQSFFEENPWIFGYGLSYVFFSPLDNKKLEQITTGWNVNRSGKRVDALMKTKGILSTLCFIEIKTHVTRLIDNNPYRADCWRVSDELAGSVAQIQKTVQKAIQEINTQTDLTVNGEPTGEKVFLYQPKSFIVIGTLDEFRSDYGTNEEKYSSFELFRRNLVNPEIVTFDELYERAKFIVQVSETDDSYSLL